MRNRFLTPYPRPGNPNPWEAAHKTYIGLKKVKMIIELDSKNVPATEIAKRLGVNIATVYRQLQRKHGKRRPGRRPKPKDSPAMPPATDQQPEVPKTGLP